MKPKRLLFIAKFNLDMSWESFVGFFPSLIKSIKSLISRVKGRKSKKVLLRIGELKAEAVKIQNQYRKEEATEQEKSELITKVINWKNEFISEVMKISEAKAKQYETLGEVDITPFLNLSDTNQRRYLGVIRKCRKLADEFLNEYSKGL